MQPKKMLKTRGNWVWVPADDATAGVGKIQKTECRKQKSKIQKSTAENRLLRKTENPLRAR